MGTLEQWLLVQRQSKVALRSVRLGASDRDGCVSDVSQITAYATSCAERRPSGDVIGYRFEPTEAVRFPFRRHHPATAGRALELTLERIYGCDKKDERPIDD
jgi:hypothetical protein